MSCSTNSGLAMLGCCTPANPCPPDRLQTVAGITLLLEIALGQDVVATPDQYAEANAFLQDRFNSMPLQEGFAIFCVGRYSPLTHALVGELSCDTQVIGTVCGQSANAYCAGGDFATPGRKSKVHANKLRITSARPFCVREIANGITGPSPSDGGLNISPGFPSPGTVTMTAFAAGTYDLIPNVNVPVPVDEFPPRSVNGNTGIQALVRGVLPACDTLLNG